MNVLLLWVANFHLLFLTISELCLFGSSLSVLGFVELASIVI
jgi:hypothetical protein